MASSSGLPEVRPVPLGDEDLRICDLPQQEVRDALLARRADEQIGIGHVRCVEMPVNVFFRDMFRAQVLVFQLRHEPAKGIQQLRSSAVIQRQRQRRARVAGRLRFYPANLFLNVRRQLMRPPNGPEANIVPLHPLDVAFQIGLQQAHQEADFGPRPSQVVFERERVECQPRQADARSRLRHQLYRFCPC